jgi:hypothetical protein
MPYVEEVLVDEFKFGGMNSVAEATSFRPVGGKYVQCTDIVDCDVDRQLNLASRDGYSLVTAGNVTSAWGNGTLTYAVMNLLLHSYDGANLNPVGNSPAMLATAEFCQVNDVIAFSDNNTIGILQDNVPYVITTPAEATDILDLETWVKLTYPAGADSDASNVEIDAFKIATYAGRCLEFFNGALYLAIDNFIFCTKTFDIEKMDLRKHVVAGFHKPVTMIKAVGNGLVVGTENGVYFLEGMAIDPGFEQRRLLPYGVVYGSAVSYNAVKVDALKQEKDAVVFMTTDGIYSAGGGGAYKDLTEGQVAMPSGSTAAACIHERLESDFYKVVVGDSTIVVNLGNGAHSRYTNYAFTSFFQIGTNRYGAKSSGIHLMGGDTDDDTAIEAYFTLPSVDFDNYKWKDCHDLFIHVRSATNMECDVTVDNVSRATNIPFGTALAEIAMVRAKLPLGIKGTNWQFTIRNTDSSRFTCFAAKARPALLKRTI